MTNGRRNGCCRSSSSSPSFGSNSSAVTRQVPWARPWASVPRNFKIPSRTRVAVGMFFQRIQIRHSEVRRMAGEQEEPGLEVFGEPAICSISPLKAACVSSPQVSG